jgi:uncharacterized protein (TIGR03083 family)
MDKKTVWKNKLSKSRAALNSLLDQLSAEQWQTTVFSEGNNWTVRDVVAHLVDSEKGMSIHIHKIRKGRETVPESFDLNQWNAGVKDRAGDASPDELRQALLAGRAKLLDGLNSLTDDEWTLTGRHPFRGVITLEQYYETIAAHEVIHAKDIKEALRLA